MKILIQKINTCIKNCIFHHFVWLFIPFFRRLLYLLKTLTCDKVERSRRTNQVAKKRSFTTVAFFTFCMNQPFGQFWPLSQQASSIPTLRAHSESALAHFNISHINIPGWNITFVTVVALFSHSASGKDYSRAANAPYINSRSTYMT